MKNFNDRIKFLLIDLGVESWIFPDFYVNANAILKT